MGPFVLVIDQGTTSSRAIVFDGRQEIAGMGKMEITQHYPASGWVEHVPEEIWATCLWACKTAMRKAGITARDIAAIGIANQRETTILWDKVTGKAIYNAIVWQDRRTDGICAALRQEGLEKQFSESTGLLIDSYFSATKIKWLLDTVPGARESAARGQLLFGTIDTYLIWRLTGGKVHVTDATNASRTLIFNIVSNCWDAELLSLLDIPQAMLPEVKDSADDYGVSESSILGAAIPIRGVAGDQQAAMIGQACFNPGMLKSTLGNSCFALLNTGRDLVRSSNRLLSTVAYRLNGETTYALEGAIFAVGGTLQWLRDDIGVLSKSADSDALAQAADENHGVYIVPAFTGLAAPWWDPDARGAIFGLTRNTGRPELVRAALEAVGYQSCDMVEAMRRDWQREGSEIVMRADGGVVASDWTMQFLSDIAGIEVERPRQHEITALGAGWLAGWGAGVWPDAQAFGAKWQMDRQFSPRMNAEARDRKLLGWRDAVSRTLSTGHIRR